MEDQKPQEIKKTLSENRKQQAQFWLEYGQQLSETIRYTEALAAIERAISLDEMQATFRKDVIRSASFSTTELGPTG